MSEHKEPIPSMIYNAAVGGHVTNSQQVIDENLNREQNDINQETVGAVPYNATAPNGMGRIVLKKNDNFKEVVEAQTDGNTIFVIKYDFTLTDNVTIPTNCVLEFDGGSVSGEYTITGANTGIQGGLAKIFNTNVSFAGTWNVVEAYPEWFGAVGNEIADDTNSIQNSINIAKKVLFDSKTYLVSSDISLRTNTIIEGNGATLKSQSLITILNVEGTEIDRLKNVVIRNISLSTVNNSLNTINGSINCSYADNIFINNVRILKDSTISQSSAIYLEKISNINISNCYVSGFYKGIFIKDGYNIKIAGNELHSADIPQKWTDNHSGISVDSSNLIRDIHNIAIFDNYLENYSLSISLRYVYGSFISNNNIINTSFGITIDRSTGIKINGNHIKIQHTETSGIVDLAIELVHSNCCIVDSNYITSSDNVSKTNHGIGIGSYAPSNITNPNNSYYNIITNNSISNLNIGIAITSNAKYNKIYDNNISDCRVGIDIKLLNIGSSTFKHNTVSNCEISNLSVEDYDQNNDYDASDIVIESNNFIQELNTGNINSVPRSTGKSTVYCCENYAKTSNSGSVLYGNFGNWKIIDNTIIAPAANYHALYIQKTSVNVSSMYFLNNTIVKGIVKFGDVDSYYIHDNIIIDGELISSDTTHKI